MLYHVPHLVNGQDRLGDEAVSGAVGEGLAAGVNILPKRVLGKDSWGSSNLI